MLTGNNPATGEPPGLKSAPNREPVPGFDPTFSTPKSVSLTWALGGPEVAGQVRQAHAASIAEAPRYMERNACRTRRGKGGREFVPGNGFLGAGYLHRSSRAGDPQLHTHVLIANATKGPDGRWSRLYHPAIYEGPRHTRGQGALSTKTADRRAGLRQHEVHPWRHPLPAARVSRLSNRREAPGRRLITC